MLKKTLFNHVTPLIKHGRKNPLQLKDLPSLPELWDPERHLKGFDQLTSDENGKKFIFQILRVLRPQAKKLALMIAVLLVLKMVSPILIHQLIEAVGAVSRGEMTLMHGLGVALFLCFSQLLSAVIGQHYVYHAVTSTQSAVNGINQRIYRSILASKDPSAKKGQVINRTSGDAELAGASLWAMGEVAQIIITMIATTSLLFFFLGTAAIAPLIIMAALMPMSKWFSSRFAKMQGEIMQHRDERVNMMSQFLDGIKTIKAFVWEKVIRDDVGQIRQKEDKAWKRFAGYKSFSTAGFMLASVLVSTVAFGIYILQGKTLDAATAFTCLSLFGYLEPCFRQLPKILGEVSSSFVAGERISSLLAETTSVKNSPVSTDDTALVLENVSIGYKDQSPLIKNLNLEVKKGESIAVVGAVGTGKSSLLKTLLNEMPAHEGVVRSADFKRTALVPQDPFLFQGSLEENITLGKPLTNQSTLDEALHASCLEHDLDFMPYALATQISEGGGNFSGGQRQRVNLARAALHSPELTLLDDPLSALDPMTEKQIVERLIFGLWTDCTRIVTTHRLKYLSRFDRILFIENSEAHIGTFDDLMATNESFRLFCSEQNKEESDAPVAEVIRPVTKKVPLDSSTQNGAVEEESQNVGEVSFKLYWNYFQAMAKFSVKGLPLTLFFLITTAVAAMLMPIIQNKWLSSWTQNLDKGNSHYELLVYAGLGMVSLLFCSLQHYYWSRKAVDAAQSLHHRALNGILSSVLRFFDANPSGRILNRFSRDMDAIEKDLSWSLEESFMAFLNSIGAVLVMVGALPFMAVVVLPVVAIYWVLQKSYRSCMREAKRLMAVARSPRISSIKEALDGAPVIRCYGADSFFHARFTNALGDYQKAFYGVVLINRWFSIRIPLVSSLLSLSAAAGIIFVGSRGGITEGIAGMALVYAFRFWDSLNWTVRAFGEAEAQMTSVERIDSLSHLEMEKDTESKLTSTFAGEIVFNNVVASYAPQLPEVLKGTSFKIEAGAKVGVIGRTGAGKSTLFSLLHRFIETKTGEILIDGNDIKDYSLQELREGIATIPQNPILFAGTIRDNLDPLHRHSDLELLHVLSKAHALPFLSEGLNTTVTEGGNNFSRGQRQLICLARALVRNASIIIVDEASASVDARTDALIRDILMNDCDGVTVLVIAHKLESVSKCEMIIEMRDGRVLDITRPVVPMEEALIA